MQDQIEVLEGETCPICKHKTLTLTESHKEIPYFGMVYLFSMSCSSCHYHKSDVETEQEQDPITVSFTVSKEEHMKVRVVKSGNATVKIPRIMTIEPGETSNGYVTNIEGLLNRVKKMLEFQKEECEEKEDQKKIKNMLKKLQDVMWGNDSITITLNDPTGNSMIIHDDAVVKKGKKK
ncbi:MAG: ZPR1 zinc finger domain-containing protein [Candidatus Woesearchaeota archaeon]